MRIAAIFMTAVALLSGAISPAHGRDRWVEARTDHFVILSNVGEEDTRALITDLEYFRHYLSLLTKVDASVPAPPLYVVAVGRQSQFLKFINNRELAGGYSATFRGGVAVVNLNKSKSKFGRNGRCTLFHEYVHHFVRQYSHFRYPRWYDEGFADYLCTFQVDDGVIKVGLPVAENFSALSRGRWLPVKTILDSNKEYVTEHSRTSNAAWQFYVQSWLMVHYFHSNAERGEQMVAYLKAANEGMPVEAAFDQSFDISMDELQKELSGYLWSKAMPYRQARFDDTNFLPQIRIRRLEGLEMDLALANARRMLAPMTGRMGQAVRAFDKVLKIEPDNVAALIGKADMLISKGEQEKAEPLLDRALALDPENSWALTNKGYLCLWRMDQLDDEAARSEALEQGRQFLRKAILNDPTNALAPYQLGRSYGWVEEWNAEEAEVAFRAAVALMPQLDGFKLMWAHYLHGSDQTGRAKALYEELATWSLIDGVVQDSASALEEIASQTTTAP